VQGKLPGRGIVKTVCLLVLPALALGANICIWNYDVLDTFYDPSLGQTVDCSYSLRQSLIGLGHSVTVSTSLPADLSGYDLVFVALGYTRWC
jgi:hypothetical protein